MCEHWKSISKVGRKRETNVQSSNENTNALLLKCSWKPKEFKRYGLKLAPEFGAAVSALGFFCFFVFLDPIADHGFHHKSVLEVTDAVARLGLPPLDAWKEEEKGDPI